MQIYFWKFSLIFFLFKGIVILVYASTILLAVAAGRLRHFKHVVKWFRMGFKSGSARTQLHLPASIMTSCAGRSYYVGSKLRHIGPCLAFVKLGLASPILELCWRYVGPLARSLQCPGSCMSEEVGLFLRCILFPNRASAWDKHCENSAGTGLCWPMLGLYWAVLAHLVSMLDPFARMLVLCWSIWNLYWGHVRPPWGYVGATLVPQQGVWHYLVFIVSFSFPNCA